LKSKEVRDIHVLHNLTPQNHSKMPDLQLTPYPYPKICTKITYQMQTWSTIVFKSSSSFQKLWLPINWEAKIVAVTHTHTHTHTQIGCIRLVKRLGWCC